MVHPFFILSPGSAGSAGCLPMLIIYIIFWYVLKKNTKKYNYFIHFYAIKNSSFMHIKKPAQNHAQAYKSKLPLCKSK